MLRTCDLQVGQRVSVGNRISFRCFSSFFSSVHSRNAHSPGASTGTDPEGSGLLSQTGVSMKAGFTPRWAIQVIPPCG